jgi:hypothetical protein
VAAVLAPHDEAQPHPVCVAPRNKPPSLFLAPRCQLSADSLTI